MLLALSRLLPVAQQRSVSWGMSVMWGGERGYAGERGGNNHPTKKSASAISNQNSRVVDMTSFPPELIRNLSIVAHIDHGKSTLASALLELTGLLSRGDKNYSGQYLDKLKVEKELGITVKAQSA